MRSVKFFNKIPALLRPGFLFFLLLGPGIASGRFPLSAYLDAVRSANGDYQAALADLASAKNSLRERSLLTSPWFVSDYHWARDRSLLADPAGSSGSNRRETSFTAGIEARSVVGLNGSARFSGVFDSVDGLHLPGYPSSVDYYSPVISVELSQDLLRNFFGRELRARRSAISRAAEGRIESARFRMAQVLCQAEILYWKTSLAAEMVRVQEDLLERSRRMNDWVSDRVDRQLQDRSDLLQSQADLQFRTLELASSRDDETGLRRSFCQAAGLARTNEDLDLVLPGPPEFNLPEAASNRSGRGDLRVLGAMDEAARMQSILKKESVTPELSAFLSASWNGLDPDLSRALADVTGFKNDRLVAGLRLRAPFDLPGVFRLRESYAADYAGRHAEYLQRKSDAESDRIELLRRIGVMNGRLLIADDLVAIQQRKSDNERERLRKGNTVTLQVLLFEQDLGRSRLMRLDLQGRLLEMLARLKLYDEGPEAR